jgi:polyphosphate kinase 2 (PPK2 family)
VVLKFWLNVSKEQQCKRFLKRLNEPEKHWKFSTGDLKERRYWNDYMQTFETALAETSRSWAPWYAIPADNKSYMRVCVADILVRTLESLDMHYPLVTQKETENFENLRQQLFNEK